MSSVKFKTRFGDRTIITSKNKTKSYLMNGRRLCRRPARRWAPNW